MRCCSDSTGSFVAGVVHAARHRHKDEMKALRIACPTRLTFKRFSSTAQAVLQSRRHGSCET